MAGQYTPGPWKLVPSGTGELLIAGNRSPDPVTRARYLWVATVHQAPADTVQMNHPTWEFLTVQEAAANARLIQESPLLLEGCQAALSLLTDDGHQGGTTWTVKRLKQLIQRTLEG